MASSRYFSPLGTVVFSFVWLAIALCPSRAAPATVVTPAPDPAFLTNPGKGFVEYGRARPGITDAYIGIGYMRFNWSSIEPLEGIYNWKPIDKFIASYSAYGKKAAFGVWNVSTGVHCDYVTPKWVFDDGAQPLAVPDDTTPSKHQIIPQTWDDPVFLSKMHQFIEALGARYDGNPNIAFIDVRSYGNWGEGHIGFLGPDVQKVSSEILKSQYFQPYFDAFPRTQLIIPWGQPDYESVYDWAVAHGAGMRRDGILSQWSRNGSECTRAYGKAPAVFEYCWGYARTKREGYWSTANLTNYIDGGRPTYMQWYDDIFAENRDYILALGNKIGYHFVLQKAVLPPRLSTRAENRVSLVWTNDGVAPLYGPCSVALALMDAHSAVVKIVWLDGSDPHKWMPGQPIEENARFRLRDIAPGKYQLAIGLFLHRADPSPAYKLGIQGRTPDNWYVLATDQEVADR